MFGRHPNLRSQDHSTHSSLSGPSKRDFLHPRGVLEDVKPVGGLGHSIVFFDQPRDFPGVLRGLEIAGALC